jgi:hypothetical protein
LGVYAAHQQIDVSLMAATVTQHDRHAVRCRCGKMHVAARSEDVADTSVSFGPNLVSWCVYLMVAHAIPVARCADLVRALTGTRPSDGFVHSLIGRAAAAVAETNRMIRTLITLAHVVSCDETPIRVGSRKVKKHLLVACTQIYTWYLLGDRSLDTFEVFVLPDLTGVVVHDRYQNYDAKIFGHLVHQLCVQHLIRDCTDAAETYPDAHWPTQIREALQGLIHAANLARKQNQPVIPAHVADPLISAYRHGVRIGLKEVPRVPGRKQPKHRARPAARQRGGAVLPGPPARAVRVLGVDGPDQQTVRRVDSPVLPRPGRTNDRLCPWPAQALRTETTINDSRDFDIGKRLCNLPALREVGFTANRRLLAVQRLSHDPAIGATAITDLTSPTHSPTGARIPALPLDSPAPRHCSPPWSSSACCPTGSATVTCAPTWRPYSPPPPKP